MDKIFIKPDASEGLKSECLSMDTKSSLYIDVVEDLPRTYTTNIKTIK